MQTDLTSEERRRLDETGCLVLDGLFDAGLLAELRARTLTLFDEEGSSAGWEFKQEPGAKRLANLIDKGEVFRRAIMMPRLLAGVRHVLGHDCKLSSLNGRSAEPYNNECQPLHCDMGAIADERGYWVCNSVWMLDDFTAENGATRYIPGSHHWGRLPQEVLENPKAPHADEALLVGKAGSVAIMNAHVWHGGTANRTGHSRLALHGFFCRRDKPQQQYQKKLVRPDVQVSLNETLRNLLALDDPLNDRISADVAVRSGFLR